MGTKGWMVSKNSNPLISQGFSLLAIGKKIIRRVLTTHVNMTQYRFSMYDWGEIVKAGCSELI